MIKDDFDKTVFPIKFSKFFKSSDKDLIKVVTELNMTKLLLFKGQIASSSYKKIYENLESKIQKICKTDKMVGFALGKSARRTIVSMFILDYNYVGMPLEMVYCETQNHIIYAQEIDKYLEYTYPKIIEQQKIGGIK
ncbi:hypothetical protein [Liquorilactobacillus hordei]|uniref:Uncharacterized protein n=1 Tax=Liquorilactobacillus hordei DSM 19519 TaxID=1423759 RepID=A0A0R1MJS9_9LACO|nr:hypothetical protein [Liquorilactobacillus hordei]KRL07953.1 hypothetical protein FC92_GL001021 [Liquorilactobacillus hordei DSM 19519]QYH51102.1 hypothetical protein G6O70_00645 [Liquorilactobacillus hordei DSM 19519]